MAYAYHLRRHTHGKALAPPPSSANDFGDVSEALLPRSSSGHMQDKAWMIIGERKSKGVGGSVGERKNRELGVGGGEEVGGRGRSVSGFMV